MEIRNRRQQGQQLIQSLMQQYNPTTLNIVSDRGICGFGYARENVQPNFIWIRAEHRPNETQIERLTIRYYRSVTDISLRHLEECAPNLKFLDVTGTSVTQAGVRMFKEKKPNCIVVTDVFKRKR